MKGIDSLSLTHVKSRPDGQCARGREKEKGTLCCRCISCTAALIMRTSLLPYPYFKGQIACGECFSLSVKCQRAEDRINNNREIALSLRLSGDDSFLQQGHQGHPSLPHLPPPPMHVLAMCIFSGELSQALMTKSTTGEFYFGIVDTIIHN